MILIKKILMKKILIKKIKYRIFLRKYKFPPETIIFFRGLCFLKYNKFSRGGVLLFLEPGLKIAGFRFRKYKKSFLLREYKEFFNIRARKFHFRKYKEFFSGALF